MKKFEITPEMLEHNADSIPHWTDDLLELVECAMIAYRETHPDYPARGYNDVIQIEVPRSYLDKPQFRDSNWHPDPIRELVALLCRHSILTRPIQHTQIGDNIYASTGSIPARVTIPEDLSGHQIIGALHRLQKALERHGFSAAEIHKLLRPFGA